jgi:hypothetical protein
LRPRFFGDVNFDHRIAVGLRRIDPGIDFLEAPRDAIDGMGDPELLCFAAAADRILVTHDTTTMPAHFADHIALGLKCSGILLVPQMMPIGRAVQALALIWACSEHESWQARIHWLAAK